MSSDADPLIRRYIDLRDAAVITQEMHDYVDAAISSIPSVDLSDYATKDELTSLGLLVGEKASQSDFSALSSNYSSYVVSNNSALSTLSSGLNSHINNVSNPHATTASQVGAYTSAQTDSLLAAKESTANKGQNNGYAGLDGAGKVPTSQLPASVLGDVKYVSTWNAATNSPTIPAANSANQGNYYVVATAGTTNISGITDWQIGDWLISNGTSWNKIDNTDSVTSVAGLAGIITPTALKGALAITASDVSGLATVATSGAYADLSGKPTLGTAASVNTGTTAGTIPVNGQAATFGATTLTGQVGIGGAIVGSASGAALQVSTSGTLSIDVHGTSTTSRRASFLFSSNLGGTYTKEFEVGSSSANDSSRSFYIYDDVRSATPFLIDASGNTTLGGTLSATGATLQAASGNNITVKNPAGTATVMSVDTTGAASFSGVVRADSNGFIASQLRPGNTNDPLSINSNYRTAAGNMVQVGGGVHIYSSGTLVPLAIVPTFSGTGTAGWTASLVNATQSSDTGSGTKLLADWQLGGTSKAKIDNAGNATFAGWLNLANVAAPATPASGTGVIYLESGSLKFKSANGNVTIIGAL